MGTGFVFMHVFAINIFDIGTGTLYAYYMIIYPFLLGFYFKLAKPCPYLNVANAQSGHLTEMVFGDETDVTCDIDSGYLTPNGKKKFTVVCIYSELMNMMTHKGLNTCESKIIDLVDAILKITVMDC